MLANTRSNGRRADRRRAPAVAEAAGPAVRRPFIGRVLAGDPHRPWLDIDRQHRPAQQPRRRHRQDARARAEIQDPRGRRWPPVSSARRQPRVEPCSPEPKAIPASSVSVMRGPAARRRDGCRGWRSGARPLLRESLVGARQPALGSRWRRGPAGRRCRWRRRASASAPAARLAGADVLDALDAPHGLAVIGLEDADRAADAGERALVGLDRLVRHGDVNRFQGGRVPPGDGVHDAASLATGST